MKKEFKTSAEKRALTLLLKWKKANDVFESLPEGLNQRDIAKLLSDCWLIEVPLLKAAHAVQKERNKK